MKLLIIGCNGFVGRNLYEYFQQHGKFSVDGTTSRDLNILDEKAVYKWLNEREYDIIIHAAVYNPRVGSGKEPDKELEYDLRMFYNFAKYHDLYGRLIYFGSGAEYDKRYPICSVTEDDWEREIPENIYGFAKYVIHQQIEKSENIYNLRIFGLYGKYENWKATFISGALCRALKNLPITIRRNVYFDYLYIDDFCRMVERFIKLEEPRYHSYNITSGKRIDLVSLAETVKRVSGKEVPVIVCSEGLANEYTADNSRLIREIGQVPLTDYEVAIKELYDFYESRETDIDLMSLLY